MNERPELDSVFAADRNRGVTPPESGEQSADVVGRPVDANEHDASFHEGTESAALEREGFSGEEALAEGGSFDGLGVPVADDVGRGSDEH
jgi:hypothetical protein